MNYNFEKFENCLKDIAKLWQVGIFVESKYREHNTRIMFDGIGKHAELLSCLLTGYKGTGTGGMGLDLVSENGGALEIKSCCTIQNCKCKKCKKKYNHIFYQKCPYCGSEEYEDMHDSRFGIKAKELLRQYEEGIFDGFLVHHIHLNNYTDKIISVDIDTYLISFNGDNEQAIQKKLLYYKNQAALGKKDNCNMLPNSYDFYMMNPDYICSYKLDIDFSNLENEPVIVKNNKSLIIRVPISIVQKKQIKTFKSIESYDEKTQTILCSDFAKNFDYKKKSLGKKRGDTRKRVDESLN